MSGARCFIVTDMKIASPRKSGRPLSFDREAALQTAMLLFWRHGYEATSVADLTAAMGITPPSLYAAFGDKKALFRAAVQRYANGPVTSAGIIAGAASARAAACGLLRAAAVGFTGADTPPGCLLATGAIACSAAAADVQGELAAIRAGIEAQLRARIDAEGLPEPAVQAAHVMAVIQGMSTLARDGAPRARLLAVADLALRGWP